MYTLKVYVNSMLHRFLLKKIYSIFTILYGLAFVLNELGGILLYHLLFRSPIVDRILIIDWVSISSFPIQPRNIFTGLSFDLTKAPFAS